MVDQPSKSAFTWLPLTTLMTRELVRFYRQRSRVVGALLTPVIFWVFLGSGLGAAFPAPATPGGKGFLEFFFPGNLLLVLLFTAIFSTITIIEDRREGFLQSVLVAPVSRTGLVGGKVWGGALLALMQGVLFLLLAPLAGFPLTFQVFGMSLVSLLASSLTLTALGFACAWHFNSMQGYHAVMNVLLFPMWLLSGAFFPVAHAPIWLKPVMYLNPLTYGMGSLQAALYHGRVDTFAGLPDFGACVVITLAFGLIFFAAGLVMVGRRSKEDVN